MIRYRFFLNFFCFAFLPFDSCLFLYKSLYTRRFYIRFVHFRYEIFCDFFPVYSVYSVYSVYVLCVVEVVFNRCFTVLYRICLEHGPYLI